MCQRECPHSERKVLNPDFKESEDAETFERNIQMCLQAISWIWEQTVFYFHWLVDKRKQDSKPFTEKSTFRFSNVGTANISTLEKRNVDCMTEKLNILKVSQVPVMHLLSLTTSRQLVTT